VIASIVASLSQESQFFTDLDEATERLQIIGAICKAPAIYASFKASRISGFLDRHIHQMMLVVGARPIFHPDRESIFAMEIHASVSLVVSDAAESEEHLTFRISLEEISELERKCSEAKKKIDVLRGMLEGVVPTRVRS
jgi:hypothetical protein